MHLCVNRTSSGSFFAPSFFQYLWEGAEMGFLKVYGRLFRIAECTFVPLIFFCFYLNALLFLKDIQYYRIVN